MRPHKQLLRRLSELHDLHFEGEALGGVGDLFEVDGAFVAEGMEEVVGGECGVAFLLEAEDEVDPPVDVLGHVGAFEGLALDFQEVFGALGPVGQLHVLRGSATRGYIDGFFVGAAAEREPETVLQEGGIRGKELGDKLADVSGVLEGRMPFLVDGVEQSVGVVELAAL